MNPLKIGVLVSGGGTNLQALIDFSLSGDLKAQIAFVATDNPAAYALQRADRHKLPKIITPYSAIIKAWDNGIQLPPHDFNLEDVLGKTPLMSTADTERRERFFITRAICEADLLQQMAAYEYDLVVLAGFMRTLTPYFLDKVQSKDRFRVMNIHPALLPAFPGRNGYGDSFNFGCKVGGCTVHFVDYGADSGPIIAQKAFDIEPEDSLDSVKAKGLQLEWQTYKKALNLYAAGKIEVVASAPDNLGKTRYVTKISI